MDNQYTPSAKNVLVLAQEQAKYFKHQAVGTEHLLLALAIEKEGIASKVMQQFNISDDDIREEIERFTGYGRPWLPWRSARDSTTRQRRRGARRRPYRT